MTLVMEIIRTIREKRMILTDTTIKTLHVRLIHEVQNLERNIIQHSFPVSTTPLLSRPFKGM